jgi:hypothetical protein
MEKFIIAHNHFITFSITENIFFSSKTKNQKL